MTKMERKEARGRVQWMRARTTPVVNVLTCGLECRLMGAFVGDELEEIYAKVLGARRTNRFGDFDCSGIDLLIGGGTRTFAIQVKSGLLGALRHLHEARLREVPSFIPVAVGLPDPHEDGRLIERTLRRDGIYLGAELREALTPVQMRAIITYAIRSRDIVFKKMERQRQSGGTVVYRPSAIPTVVTSGQTTPAKLALSRHEARALLVKRYGIGALAGVRI